MTHRVPVWGMDSNSLDTDVHSPANNDLFSSLKSKWVILQHTKRTPHDDMAYVPEGEFAEPNWADVPSSGPLHTSKDSDSALKQQWALQTKDQGDWDAGNANGPIPKLQDDIERPAVNGESLVDNPMSGQACQDQHLQTSWHGDEMESWLQLEDPPGSNEPGHDIWPDMAQFQTTAPKDTVGIAPAKSPPRSLPMPLPLVDSHQSARAANAESHMALGAQRAAGLIPAAGVEAFSKVRSSSMPTITTSSVKWTGGCVGLGVGPMSASKPDGLAPSQAGNDKIMQGSMSMPTSVDPPLESPMQLAGPSTRGASAWQPESYAALSAGATQMMMPPPLRSTHMNFSHFSRPAALYSRSSMQQMGAVLAGTAALGKPGAKFGDKSYNSNTSSVADSTVMTSSMPSLDAGNASKAAAGSAGSERMQRMQGHSAQGSEGTAGESCGRPLGKGPQGMPFLCPIYGQRKALDDGAEVGQTSTMTSSDAAGLLKRTLHRRSSLETTVTSSCGGESSGVRGKDGAPEDSSKGKRSGEEAADDRSEDIVEDSLYTKKTAVARPGNTSTKRSRAAEVHNLSERRRRDRINERMRALQELIPNSNKTDKASMLDEAIEYLKMLQLQLQLMSRRSAGGMNPMMAQQQMPMHGLPPMAMAGMGMHMGMGLAMGGMGMGMGMGPMGGMGVGAMGPMGLGDLPGLPSSHLMDGDRPMGCSPQELLAETAPVRQVNPMQLDPRAASYMAARQPAMQQTTRQPMTMDMYQVMLLQQQQQEQQQQQQQKMGRPGR